MVWPLTPLCEISRKYGCEKGGVQHPFPIARAIANPFHEYTPVYWDLFGHWAAEAKFVLEIGINEGRSLRMWRDFFANARIHGFDIRHQTLIHEDRINSFECDQSDPDSLGWALTLAGDQLYDVIIEDGSHLYDDQLISMLRLLPRLQPHGIYVCEDSNLDGEKRLLQPPPGYTMKVYRWENDSHSLLQVIHGPQYQMPFQFRRLVTHHEVVSK